MISEITSHDRERDNGHLPSSLAEGTDLPAVSRRWHVGPCMGAVGRWRWVQDGAGHQRSASDVENAAENGRAENHPVLPGPGVRASEPHGALPCRPTQLAGVPVRHRAHDCRRVRLKPLSRPGGGHPPPGATDLRSASGAPRPGRSARAPRAGCRSELHEKNWGATRHVEQAKNKGLALGGVPGGVGPSDPSGPFSPDVS
jgi:hypothetical protein